MASFSVRRQSLKRCETRPEFWVKPFENNLYMRSIAWLWTLPRQFWSSTHCPLVNSPLGWDEHPDPWRLPPNLQEMQKMKSKARTSKHILGTWPKRASEELFGAALWSSSKHRDGLSFPLNPLDLQLVDARPSNLLWWCHQRHWCLRHLGLVLRLAAFLKRRRPTY